MIKDPVNRGILYVKLGYIAGTVKGGSYYNPFNNSYRSLKMDFIKNGSHIGSRICLEIKK